ncbi:MAG: MBL fold metallo-hydrolase [Candidatus Latescibacterota bacterium]|nr:MAG: MBL fold metallo-hydrolase [Candidatus Latescibacterota bacterium]
MKIGSWEVNPVVAGMFRLDGGAMFGVVPKNLWSRVAPADDENRISMAMRNLVIRGQGRVVVVDTGSGIGYGKKLENIYGFENFVSLTDALRDIDLKPEDVTDVILTHLHFDHAGGAAIQDGAGWKLAFPNAAHHIQNAQWEHALNPNPRDRASYFSERIAPIESEGVLELHDGDWALCPGLDVLAFHGHTPGQHLPRLSVDRVALFYCGDLIPTAAHIPTPYVMAYDLDPVLAMEEKTAVLKRAADEDWILVFEHDPSVEACRVEVLDGRFQLGETVTL